MRHVLHDENFQRIPLTGWLVQRRLQARAQSVARSAAGMTDPNVSVVIRTQNDEAYIKQLFKDIKAQDFDGNIEIILVDTESADNTVPYARSQGAKVIGIRQKDFTYPSALNKGFQAAKHPWVVSLVGHSALTNRMMLKSLTQWCQDEKVAGLYGVPLANWDGSFWDGLSGTPLVLTLKSARVSTGKSEPGMLGANCSIVRREVWERLGGYDERYAGGGEDTALARTMMANGFCVVREPLCSVFHSHGLNFVDSVKQWLHWLEVSKDRPQPFNAPKLHARRPDLRRKSTD